MFGVWTNIRAMMAESSSNSHFMKPKREESSNFFILPINSNIEDNPAKFKLVVCQRFAHGLCEKSDDECEFSHGSPFREALSKINILPEPERSKFTPITPPPAQTNIAGVETKSRNWKSQTPSTKPTKVLNPNASEFCPGRQTQSRKPEKSERSMNHNPKVLMGPPILAIKIKQKSTSSKQGNGRSANRNKALLNSMDESRLAVTTGRENCTPDKDVQLGNKLSNTILTQSQTSNLLDPLINNTANAVMPPLPVSYATAAARAPGGTVAKGNETESKVNNNDVGGVEKRRGEQGEFWSNVKQQLSTLEIDSGRESSTSSSSSLVPPKSPTEASSSSSSSSCSS